MKQNTYNFNQISRIRGVLFGISTILIVVFHSVGLKDASSFAVTNYIVNFFLYYGNIGVDIFLMLSGVGLYYSYSKDEATKPFYKRRAVRILPALMVVAIIYNTLLLLLHKISLKYFLASITMTSFLIYGQREFWFFSLIILLYALYPPLYHVLKKHGVKGLVAICMLLSAGMIILKLYFPILFNRYEIALTRIFSFLIGAWLGKYIKNNKTVRLMPVVIASCLTLIGAGISFCCFFHWLDANYYVVRLLLCPVSLASVILLSIIWPTRKRIADRALIWIGSLSCEIYLLYERLAAVLNKVCSLLGISRDNVWLFYLFLFCITVIFSFLLNKACKIVQNKLNRISTKSIIHQE